MKYDLAIIGGGPAGLMAACRASELGSKVIVIEKNSRLGLKLLMSGGGRCNITNNIPDYHLLAASFGSSGRFLLSVFSRFGASETINFFESRGLKTKTEKDNQVFPQSDRASEVLNILIDEIKQFGGVIKTGNSLFKVILKGDLIDKIILADGQEVLAKNYLITTGGLSYPLSGSNGDGYDWLRSCGHTIKPLRPALAPILVREKFVKDLEGLSLDNVVLSLYRKGKRIALESGPIIFTAHGVSGPAALNISRHIDFKLATDFRLDIDLQFQYSVDQLNQLLRKLMSTSNKLLRNNLEGVVPSRLAELLLSLSGLGVDRIANSLSRLERERLTSQIKAFSLTIEAVAGFDRAMVTGGGLDLKEIDSTTMRSKLVANLFVAGEILDLVGPTGGYNLQLCWSTGRAAGEAASKS